MSAPTHPVQCNPTSPNHGFVDDPIVPTPLRGIIDMRAVPPDLGFATMREWVETMVPRTGHYWLSPADLMIRMADDRPAPYARGDDG